MAQIVLYSLIALGLTIILIHPHWGIILLFVSVALTKTLPDFPIIDSVFPIWGLATIMGFVIKNFQYKREYIVRFELIYVFAMFFVIWIFVSNPVAATSGGTRNWILTFVQLFILASLTGILMNDRKKYHTLMFWFAIAVAGSAIYGITNTSIESTRMASEIEAGLLGGKNTAARYYIIAALFAFYLQKVSVNQIRRILLRTVMIILVVGVLFTLSRAGLGLLAFAVLMVILVEFKFALKHIVSITLIVGIILIIIPGALFETYDSVITGREFQTGGRGAEHSSVENNIRYTLWNSGIEMWKTAPLTGLGIGQFPFQVASYLPFSLAYLNLGAHNMFIQLLAETGSVGFLLFMIMLFYAFVNFRKQLDGENNINRIWMIAFFVMVLGGLMKHDHYDKLLWLLIGASVALKNYWIFIKPQSGDV